MRVVAVPGVATPGLKVHQSTRAGRCSRHELTRVVPLCATVTATPGHDRGVPQRSGTSDRRPRRRDADGGEGSSDEHRVEPPPRRIRRDGRKNRVGRAENRAGRAEIGRDGQKSGRSPLNWAGNGVRRQWGSSGPAGDLVLQALVQLAELDLAPPVDLAQSDHADEDQRRSKSGDCAENRHTRCAGTTAFLAHDRSCTPCERALYIIGITCVAASQALGIGW